MVDMQTEEPKAGEKQSAPEVTDHPMFDDLMKTAGALITGEIFQAAQPVALMLGANDRANKVTVTTNIGLQAFARTLAAGGVVLGQTKEECIESLGVIVEALRANLEGNVFDEALAAYKDFKARSGEIADILGGEGNRD